MSDDEMSMSTPMSYRSAYGRGADGYSFLSEHLENYNIERSALHRKLQSKAEALRILRKELEKFRTERDQFKLMAETLQLRYSTIKRSSDMAGYGGLGMGKTSVANILHETRERNLRLTTEVESLKQKLNELQGDMELLRNKEPRSVQTVETSVSKEQQQWKLERSNIISYMEDLKKKNAQLAFDFKALIDEKEEIITERDAYKCKAHRLNHELFVALKANEMHPKFLDVDSILLENKYLHEHVKNCESELELTKQSMNKYKTMLESKRKKGIIKLGSGSNDENILSHKQVKHLLESGIDLPTKTETIHDLKSLCLAVLDSLNDKNLALSHQKKTNKLLATKIAELEQRVHALAGLESATAPSVYKDVYAPSQLLLQGYCPSLVDAEDAPPANSKPVKATTDDSGTMSSEPDDSNKTSHAISDDCMSSLSSESAHSILSSEYGNDLATCTAFQLRDFSKLPMQTLNSNGSIAYNKQKSIYQIPSSIAKERMNDLKDLPADLAAMVQQALHELDMRDFEAAMAASGYASELTMQAHQQKPDEVFNEELEDDDTIH